MTINIIRHDVEGDFIRFQHDQEGIHLYGKVLPLDIAWHIGDLEDLAFFSEDLIREVVQEFDANRMVVHYQSGISLIDKTALKDIIGVESPFFLWRMATMAADLVTALMKLHANGLFQMVIHPGRLGLIKDTLCILPSLACYLPPFETLAVQKDLDWLHCIAPELLRTRCNDTNLLERADVYSLGRTLAQMASGLPEMEPITDPFEKIEKIVECPGLDCAHNNDETSDVNDFLDFVSTMCHVDPARRPGLKGCLDTITQTWITPLNPLSLTTEKILKNDTGDIDADLEALASVQASQRFGFPIQKLYRLRADRLLNDSDPDWGQAISQLQKINDLQPNDIKTLKDLAICYENLTRHPQHLKMSANYYEQAAAASNWEQDITASLLDVLVRLDDPLTSYRALETIPSDRRSRQVQTVIIKSLVQSEEFLRAWHSAARFFKVEGFDDTIFSLARDAAQGIEPTKLIGLKSCYTDIKGMEPLEAIIWERNGNFAKAKECLKAFLPGPQT